TIEIANSTTYTLSFDTEPGVLETFTGAGFTYDANFLPTGGTANQFTMTDSGVLLLKVSGFSVPATDLLRWAVTDDNASMFQAMLGGTNTINGGTGADELRGWGLADSITAGAGNDTLVGGAGNETLFGGDGNDSISGGSGFDQVNGNKG